MKPHLRLAAVIVCVTVILVLGRIFIGSIQEFNTAERLIKSGDQEEALVHYSRAIRWYFPGNPYVGRSLEGIYEIAKEAEKGQDYHLALNSYRLAHSSLLATRSLYQPYRDGVVNAKKLIAKYTVLVEDSGELTEAKVLASLEQSQDPNLLWSIFSVFAFFGWIGGVVGFIYTGFNNTGSFTGGRQSTLSGIAAMLLFFCWLIGLWMA